MHLDDINQLLKAKSQWKFIVYANLNSIELSAADCLLFHRHEKWWKSFKSHKTHQIIQIQLKCSTNGHSLMHDVQFARSPTIVKFSSAQWCWFNGTFKKETFLSLHFQRKKRLDGENTETTNLSLNSRALTLVAHPH